MDDKVEGVAESEISKTGTNEDIEVSQKLANERKRQDLSLQQISERTRLSIRQLASMEAGDYSVFPGNTYILGFTRSYARALDLDAEKLVEQLREELSLKKSSGNGYGDGDYEPADPGRIPPKFFTWGAIAVLIIILAAYAFWRSQADEPDLTVAEQAAPTEIVEPGPVAEEDNSDGPVVLTATQDVWLRVYERDGEKLFEDRLTEGKSFTLPEAAEEPLLLTGRPQALSVTVGGKQVPPLGKADYTISDMPIDAQSLLARAEVSDEGTATAQPTGAE